MKVYFRFLGDRSLHVDDAHVAIDQACLETVHESLLSKLATDIWKSSESAGSTKDNPIITRPLETPCKEVWTPDLGNMIVDAYKWEFAKRQTSAQKNEKHEVPPPPLVKLPENVEFEDALLVLDYFGVMKDELNSFDLEDTSDDVQLRALLYLKWLNKVEEARLFILDTIKSDAKVNNLFLSVSSQYDMDFINAQKRNGTEKFIRIGDDSSCVDHFEWITHHQKLRNYLVLLLEEQSGLTARWKNKNYAIGLDRYGIHDGYFRPSPGMSIVLVREDTYNDYDGSDELFVLQVEVPMANKKQRTIE